jgi:NAD(P)-dependent dehydrogenase (short-subunit alcohol dehydrogenase family)
VLVNNVDKSEPATPGEMDEALWDSQLAVNLKSAFLCCQAVLPIMQKQGKGAVVSIASTAGIRYTGKPQAAYSAAKAGRKISPDERRRVPERRSDRRR